jgi:hypothetical protein
MLMTYSSTYARPRLKVKGTRKLWDKDARRQSEFENQ